MRRWAIGVFAETLMVGNVGDFGLERKDGKIATNGRYVALLGTQV